MNSLMAKNMVERNIMRSGLKGSLPSSGWAKIPDALKLVLGCDERINRYGAGCFASFCFDTLHVESVLVTPACSQMVSLFCLTNDQRVMIDCTISEEGDHYREALSLVKQIERQFDINVQMSANDIPMFLRRLNAMKHEIPVDKHGLFNFLCCVVTETRISNELGKHSFDTSLNDWVRANCRQHQQDEKLHHKLFCDLAKQAWSVLSEEDISFMMDYFPKVIIARSTPDVTRYAWLIEQTLEGITSNEAMDLASNVYNIDYIQQETIGVTYATIDLLKDLNAISSEGAEVLRCFGYKL